MAAKDSTTMEERMVALEGRQEELEKRQKEYEVRLGKIEEFLGVGTGADAGKNLQARLEKVEEVMESGSSFAEILKGKGKASRISVQAGNSTGKQPEISGGHAGSKAMWQKRRANGAEDSKVVSFAEECASMKEGTVLLFGSSMVRGVGERLHEDNKLYGKLDFGGARIENIQEKVALVGDKPESHVVFMVGTNNLIKEDRDEMMRKYRDLMEAIKERKYKKVSFVGILPRADPWMSWDRWEVIDAKRLTVNLDLARLCVENGVEYLDIAETVKVKSMIDNRGLHLNRRGQEHVAREVFDHCYKFLN
jgi:hypothetical protein